MSQVQSKRLLALIEALAAERGHTEALEIPANEQGRRDLLRALMNVRMPAPLDTDVAALQDTYLEERLRERGGAIDVRSLDPVDAEDELLAHVYLWRGDITLLAADAIVNAANSRMLGCFVPGHRCIDNAIHTFAGMQLRLVCHKLMTAQGHDEPTGRAKATPAFNLPSRHVIHTVGPIVRGGQPTARDEAQLRSCYRSCLHAADELGCESIAFCCISTGLFGYPQEAAAHIAIREGLDHLKTSNPRLRIVYDVFTDADEFLYRKLLTSASTV